MSLNLDELAISIRVLQKIADEPTLIDDDQHLKTLVEKIHKNGKRLKRFRIKKQLKEADRTLTEATELVSGVRILSADECQRSLNRPRSCYVCKAFYTELHHFYHQLCPDCAALNWEKRDLRTDLTGRIALITGGRIKIGFQTALKLLRDGARVIVTTRFPGDAAARFQSETDFADWRERLEITGLDFRDIPAVEQLAESLNASLPFLDIVIHNAAQTVKRPLDFYRHLLEPRTLTAEARDLIRNETTTPILLDARPGYQGNLPGLSEAFPPGNLDREGQQVDLRPLNSWRLRLGDISTIEMLEVCLVNAAAPFVLTSRLRSLMKKSPHPLRFVINVSAMEGQFSKEFKTVHHPHTNMAKAALNMLTRTSADDLKFDSILMNSVDTGWVTDEKPYPDAQRMQEVQGFYPPLDTLDGASRVYDPIVTGINDPKSAVAGQFLKDYRPCAW